MILATLLAGQAVVPHNGLVISSSTKLKAGTYVLQTNENLSQPAIEIKGNNLTLDFKGVVLRGTSQSVEPDQRKGLGIRVSGNNITIKNLGVHGYKVALIADKCSGLKLIDSDLSYNWKQHLGSTLEKEDLNDWMSYHQNEKDEWLRYGAGAYFKDVNGFEVRNLKVVGGQCGLMLMRSNKGLIWNSNLSFLSGIGLGMYRSSSNRIMHNNIDWCVRGYSHGVYNRGQDSAGILIYEQSNKNVFAYNSVTHGGDGFFLWAGQTTMDNGKGGCNDNLLYGNDFSHAPTNGIEATFSRNKFINNKLDECWHGFWTGYSYDSVIEGNMITNCEEGIAHEHGQDNKIEKNIFNNNKTDIHIWSNASQDPNWGYPKNRDTRSRDWKIEDNTFITPKGSKTLRISRTEGVVYARNTSYGAAFDLAPDVKKFIFGETRIVGDLGKGDVPEQEGREKVKFEHLTGKITVEPWEPFEEEAEYKDEAPERIKGGKVPFILGRRGRQYIMVDEWGPYDFQGPKLWPSSYYKDGSIRYDIFGPAGTWKLKTADGFTTRATSGQVPGFVVIKPVKGSTMQKLELTYSGKAFVDYKGVFHKAGESFPLSIQRYDIPIDWRVKFFEFDANSEDPRTHFDAYQAKSKIANDLVFLKSKLDYTGYGRFEKGVPNNHFGTIAEGTLDIKPGDYALELTGDDGVRMWLDDKLVVDEWHYQGPTMYVVKAKLGGRHKLRIEHFQLDGYSALQLKIRPAK